jgi:hypothetical protein
VRAALLVTAISGYATAPTLPTPHSEREKVMALSGLSFVIIFFLTNVASVAFSALVFGAAAIAAHGATRVPDDLFIDESEVRV